MYFLRSNVLAKGAFLNISKSKNGVYSTYSENNSEIEANSKRKSLASFGERGSSYIRTEKKEALKSLFKKKAFNIVFIKEI